MIINKTTKIILNSSNINRYKGFGYIGNVGNEIEVDIKHLSKGSHALIPVKCDKCGIDKEIEYNQLVSYDYIDFYFCFQKSTVFS